MRHAYIPGVDRGLEADLRLILTGSSSLAGVTPLMSMLDAPFLVRIGVAMDIAIVQLDFGMSDIN